MSASTGDFYDDDTGKPTPNNYQGNGRFPGGTIMKKRGDGKRKTVHHLIDEVQKSDGLVPVMLIFGDRNNDDRMLLTGQVIREDFTRLLAKAAVFAETGRPGTEEEVAFILAAVQTAVSEEAS